MEGRRTKTLCLCISDLPPHPVLPHHLKGSHEEQKSHRRPHHHPRLLLPRLPVIGEKFENLENIERLLLKRNTYLLSSNNLPPHYETMTLPAPLPPILHHCPPHSLTNPVVSEQAINILF